MNGLRNLYFHLVTPSPKTYFPSSTTLHPDVLERQIKFLRRRYGFIGLDEVQQRMQQGKQFKNEVLLTTDDGFKENHSVLMPILDTYKVPALFFLITNSLNNQHLMWRHLIFHLDNYLPADIKTRLMRETALENGIALPFQGEGLASWSFRAFPMEHKDELSKQLWERGGLKSVNEFLKEEDVYLNDEDVKELLNAGHKVGSHSASHPDCARLSSEELKKEMIESAAFIEERYETKVTSFSFPFGRPENEEITEQVASIGGIEMIFGIREGKKGSNHSKRLERTSIEMGYHKFLLNFHFNPIREKYLR